MTLSIKNIPPSERPRERCLRQGAEHLSLRECLALVIGSGSKTKSCLDISAEILNRMGPELSIKNQENSLLTQILENPSHPISNIPGLGDAGRSRLLAAFELARRIARYEEQRSLSIATSTDRKANRPIDIQTRALRAIPIEMRSAPKEWIGFFPIFPHRRNPLGEFCGIEQGVRTHVNFEPASLFSALLNLRPHSFILVHNHPSKWAEPSEEDWHLTREVSEVALKLGIPLIGHWIVTSQQEYWISGEGPW